MEYKLTVKSYREEIYRAEGNNIERLLEDLTTYIDEKILQLTKEEREARRKKV